MGTRAATFSAKIKSLRESQAKVSGSVVPIPTGTDLAMSYKWFSGTLLAIQKDVPGLPFSMLRQTGGHIITIQMFFWHTARHSEGCARASLPYTIL